MGRFVNAEDAAILLLAQEGLLKHNMFVYCMNNPINNSDPSGYFAAGKRFAAKVFDLKNAGIAGGGVGAVQKFILRKGMAEAKKLFTRTIVSKLIPWVHQSYLGL